jgi:hypothetical protein
LKGEGIDDTARALPFFQSEEERLTNSFDLPSTDFSYPFNSVSQLGEQLYQSRLRNVLARPRIHVLHACH